jgi:hypothetical protein
MPWRGEVWHEERRNRVVPQAAVRAWPVLSAGRAIQLPRKSQKGTASLGFNVLIGCHPGGFGRLL